MKRAWVALLVAVTLTAVAGCGDDGAGTGSAGSEPSGEVLVFAAASLTDAFGEMTTAFETAHPGVEVQLGFAGSSTLREQILQGAPADVFASANEATMAEVSEAGEVAGAPEAFATNRLQIAVPAGNPGEVTGLSDLARADLLVGLCAEGVPCGDLGREALANAGVDPSIDTNEPDVRALLTKLGADELDVGIVYETDVRSAGDRVEGIDLPAADNVLATYPIAQLVSAPNPAGAAAFIAFVRSAEGRRILDGHGFGAP